MTKEFSVASLLWLDWNTNVFQTHITSGIHSTYLLYLCGLYSALSLMETTLYQASGCLDLYMHSQDFGQSPTEKPPIWVLASFSTAPGILGLYPTHDWHFCNSELCPIILSLVNSSRNYSQKIAKTKALGWLS